MLQLTSCQLLLVRRHFQVNEEQLNADKVDSALDPGDQVVIPSTPGPSQKSNRNQWKVPSTGDTIRIKTGSTSRGCDNFGVFVIFFSKAKFRVLGLRILFQC